MEPLDGAFPLGAAGRVAPRRMIDPNDDWPPLDVPTEGAVAPMFPLGRVFLFPRQVLPLHIFEPRYRQMIDDLLDGAGRIVMATPTEGTDGSEPDVLPVGGLGEIMRHEALDDGRYLIWLLGLTRVRLRELDSDRLYRRVHYTPLDETAVPEELEDGLRVELRDAIEQRVGGELELPDDMPAHVLTDLLLQTVQPPPRVMERIFSEGRLAERARMALAVSRNDDA